MRRSALLRKTPLAPGKPLARGTVRLRAVKPKVAKPRRAAREATDKHMADLCRGQTCFLLIPGICNGDRATVVPAHSNQSHHGKGMGMKAHHRFTLPACHACHTEIDSGHRLTRAEKFALWDAAYARWAPVRDQLLQANFQL